MRQTSNAGFTLVELLVTIAIMAILLAIGLPSFQGSLRSNRVSTASNELLAAINTARSEAIRTTHGATVCATSNGTSCDVDWSKGWLVWSDRDGNGVLNAATERVRLSQAHSTIAIASSAGSISFDARGRPNAARNITIKPADCATGEQGKKTLAVNGVGQASMNSGSQACP